MIDALISGKLIRDPSRKIAKTGNNYIQFLLSVHIGEPETIVVSGIAFDEIAEKIALLKKGDSLAVVGSLKPSEWIDKTTGETRHGLSITVNNSLSPYDIKKRKPNVKPKKTEVDSSDENEPVYDDELLF